MNRKKYRLKKHSITKIRGLLKDRTYQQVADMIGCSRQAVHSFVRYHDVWEARNRTLPPRKKTYDYDLIVNLRKKGLSIDEISERIGCSRPTVYLALRIKGITIPPSTQMLNDKAWLKDQYDVQKKSLLAISRLAKTSIPSVTRYLKKFKIKVRPKGRPRKY